MDSLEFFRAVQILSGNWTGQTAEAVFFHGRALEDHDGLFELASGIHFQTKAKVVINGSKGERFGSDIPAQAWPGKGVYISLLKAHCVWGESVACSRPAFHTRDENEVFIEWAKENGAHSAVVISHPHQLPRIFLGMLHAAKAHNYEISIYSVAPKYTDWCKKVSSNQGLEIKPRYENIGEELFRVLRGQEEYANLAGYDELFSYLESYKNASTM